MKRAMDVLRPADLPGISVILAGKTPDRHVPEWRIRAFAGLSRLPESLSAGVLEWAMVECLGNWSLQRQALPWQAQEALRDAGLRGSGRWNADDGGGHWGLVSAALVDAEATRTEVYFSSEEWTDQKGIQAQEQRRRAALYFFWTRQGDMTEKLLSYAEAIYEEKQKKQEEVA